MAKNLHYVRPGFRHETARRSDMLAQVQEKARARSKGNGRGHLANERSAQRESLKIMALKTIHKNNERKGKKTWTHRNAASLLRISAMREI